jgi:hypothetical protein
MDRHEAGAEADRRAVDIRELCQIGGVPEMADAFIASQIETPETVRHSLATCARVPPC